MNADQLEEVEALRSIYAGDERFLEIGNAKFQYKIGESNLPLALYAKKKVRLSSIFFHLGDTDHFRSFIVEISWPTNYPQEDLPTVSLDLFYNKHLAVEVKSTILNALLEEARAYAGMPATYALFEFARENGDRLAEAQHEPIPTVENVAEEDENVVTAKDDSAFSSTSTKHLSKAQKRRMWDRGEMTGDRPRGWNWVDVVRHLSQTGAQSL